MLRLVIWLFDLVRLTAPGRCRKYGHQWETEIYRVYRESDPPDTGFAFRVVYEQEICYRCLKERPPVEVRRTPVEDLQLSEEMWEIFYKRGEVRVDI
jgi:hypothetical protein